MDIARPTSGSSTPAPDRASSVDPRTAPRYTLILRQAKLRARAGEFLCVIRDVSETGISIRTFHPLPPGDRFAIELREGCPYLIEKVWEKEGEAGFRFRDRVALDQLLEDDARFPRRQMRVEVDLPVDVTAEGRLASGRIVNLSQQGARLEADRSWAREQLLHLHIGGLPPLYAKVRWRRDFTHGLVFEETFSLRDFAYMLARLREIV